MSNYKIFVKYMSSIKIIRASHATHIYLYKNLKNKF